MGIMRTLTINGVKYNVVPSVPASSVTLLASAWEGSGHEYSQVVKIPGVTAHTKVDLQPTSKQLVEFHDKVLGFVAENDGGVITVYSIGDKPSNNHTIQVTMTEVDATGKIRGNTVGTTVPQSDWSQTDPTKADYIKNKPTGMGENGNGSGQNVALDTTLTQSGAAADAKATGDRIKQVEANIPTKPEDIGAESAGTVAASIQSHDVGRYAHSDIRGELRVLADRVNVVLNSDDVTLDQMAEIVAYIKSNKTLIDAITTGKVSVSDIVDNLTTNVANRPLSAAMGVELKRLYDTIAASLSGYQPKGNYALASAIPTKVSQLVNDKGYLIQHQDISGKADKAGLTLGIHTDGLIYLFVDNKPVGTGIELSAGGIGGYIDSANNIVITGLPDGSYTVKYEMEDGSTINIGDLNLDTNVYYSVTNNLTNCVNNTSTTQVAQGENYSAVITANTGYELKSMVVTMGGSHVSVSGGNINIAAVTGDIVITAVAEEMVVGPTYTNLADPTSPEWMENHRISSSGVVEESNGVTLVNTIDVDTEGVVRIKGMTGVVTGLYKNGTWFARKTVNTTNFNDANLVLDGDYTQFRPGKACTDLTAIRFYGTLSGTAADVIVTVNEEIV